MKKTITSFADFQEFANCCGFDNNYTQLKWEKWFLDQKESFYYFDENDYFNVYFDGEEIYAEWEEGFIAEIVREKMINEMIGKKVIVDAEWLKGNDSATLNYIMDSEYCDFAEEETVLEIQFDEGGTRSYACSESATCDIPSQNQPPWWDGSWGDWKIEDIQLYYKKLK